MADTEVCQHSTIIAAELSDRILVNYCRKQFALLQSEGAAGVLTLIVTAVSTNSKPQRPLPYE
jgi:hypothetical protein